MTDTLPTTVARSGLRSSTCDAAVLTRMRSHISNHEERLSDPSTVQNVDLNVTAAIGALTECQRTVVDVLRWVIEFNARYGLSPIPALNIDAVIQWCIAVRHELDETFTALVSSNEEALLMS